MKGAGMFYAIGYLLTIVAANWAIQRFGLVPVGFGLMAPAGVYFAGLAFTLRDLTQEVLGRAWCVVAIVAGALLSLTLGDGRIALASGAAFLLSELADFAVYQPLRERRWLLAVALSNTVGALVDSAIFLGLAFGSLAFLPGQVVGKSWVTLLAIGVLWVWRRRDLSVGVRPVGAHRASGD